MTKVTFNLSNPSYGLRDIFNKVRTEALAEIYEDIEAVLPWKPASSRESACLTAELEGDE